MFLGFPARKWGILVQLELQTNCLLRQKKRTCRDIFPANGILEKIFIACSLQFGLICVKRVMKNDNLPNTLFGLKGI